MFCFRSLADKLSERPSVMFWSDGQNISISFTFSMMNFLITICETGSNNPQNQICSLIWENLIISLNMDIWEAVWCVTFILGGDQSQIKKERRDMVTTNNMSAHRLRFFVYACSCLCQKKCIFAGRCVSTWACGRSVGTNNTNYISVDKHMEIAGCEIDFRLWNNNMKKNKNPLRWFLRLFRGGAYRSVPVHSLQFN